MRALVGHRYRKVRIREMRQNSSTKNCLLNIIFKFDRYTLSFS